MEFFENSFSGGLNQDTDPRAVPNNSYIDSRNITMFGNAEYGSINPLPGTIDLGDIISGGSSNKRISKLVSTPILTPDGEEDGLVAFGLHVNPNNELLLDVIAIRIRQPITSENASVTLPERQGARVEIGSKTLLYRRNLGQFNEDLEERYYRGNIEFVLFKEQNVPVIYYADGSDPLRRVICDITLNILPFIDSETLAVPVGIGSPPEVFPVDGNTFSGVTLNSSLVLCGTYQAAVRFLNPETNQSTKWSLFSNPVGVSDVEDDGGVLFNSGGVGKTSNKRIAIRVPIPSGINISRFRQYQLAVIENTTGTGIPKLIANVTPPRDVGSASSRIYAYSNGEFEEQINTDEIVIDDAPIISCKSITIKNGRLIQGGLTYRDFDFDNGDPEVVSGSLLINKQNNTPYSLINDGEVSTFYFSLFRDEVYRFGAVYHDDFGNWSPVKTLDLSGLSFNRAESGCIDLKTPSIREESLFDALGKPKHINISLSVRNHPSWARGIALVRAKRIKNIQFQTPVIPSRFIQAPFASENYPQLGSPNPNPDAQIGNILGTLAPKELSDLYPVSFVQDGRFGTQIQYTQDDVTTDPPGDNSINRSTVSGIGSSRYSHVLFNPNNLSNFASANFDPYVFQDGDTLDIVDTMYLRGVYERMDNYQSDLISGFDIQAAELSVFVDDTRRRYYFQGNSIPTLQSRGIVESNYEVKDYQEMVFAQERITFSKSPKSLISGSFGDYASLDASGLSEGITPINQAMAVVVTDNELFDPVFFFNRSKIVNSDRTVRYNLNQATVFNDPLQVDIATGLIIPEQLQGASEGDTFRGMVKRNQCAAHIANLTRNLSDFRYGERDTRHEFVFVGGYKPISDVDISQNVSVPLSAIGGGDCHLSAHSFKISDTGYVKAGTRNDLVFSSGAGPTLLGSAKYGLSFEVPGTGVSIPIVGTLGNHEYSRPIPARSRPETITLFLESEIDGARINNFEHTRRINIFDVSTPFPNGAGEGNTPFSYRYHLDYSLPNNNKVFFPPLRDSENNNEFLSRLIFSDPKIYNTRDNGLSRFRVGNILDLDEGYGPVNKISLVSDQVICFQDESIVYVPADSNIIEQSDAATLAIRTDEFLGVPIYLSNAMGCSSPGSVIDNGRGLYFLDDQNKNIMYMEGRSFSNISNIDNAAFFETSFSSNGFDSRNVNSFFDFERDELVFTSGVGFDAPSTDLFTPIFMIYSEKNNKWITKVYIGDHSGGLNPGIDKIPGSYTRYGLFLCSDNAELHQSGMRNESRFLNFSADPYVRFSINPSSSSSKVYDVFTVNSNRKPKSISIYTNYTLNNLTYRNFEEQTSMNIDGIFPRENTFRSPILRTISGQRVRGNYAVGEILFDTVFLTDDDDNPNNKHAVTSILTHYRFSERRV